MVDAAWEKMGRWEMAVLNWYHENACGWAARVGVVADSFKVLRLKGTARMMFLKAMQIIESEYDEIRAKMKDE
jgi:hypothetical protein